MEALFVSDNDSKSIFTALIAEMQANPTTRLLLSQHFVTMPFPAQLETKIKGFHGDQNIDIVFLMLINSVGRDGSNNTITEVDEMLKTPVNVNYRDKSSGKSALYTVISKLFVPDTLGWAPLYKELLQPIHDLLIKKGATLSTLDTFSTNQLHIAAEENNVMIFEWWQSHGNPDDIYQKDIDGVTPLYIAIRKHHIDIVRIIIQHHNTEKTIAKFKTQLETPISNGATPLWSFLYFVNDDVSHQRSLTLKSLLLNPENEPKTLFVETDVDDGWEDVRPVHHLTPKLVSYMNSVETSMKNKEPADENKYKPYRRMTGNILTGSVHKPNDELFVFKCNSWSTLMHTLKHTTQGSKLSYTIHLLHLGRDLQFGFSVNNDEDGVEHGVLKKPHYCNDGVGDTQQSWAVDGVRNCIWNLHNSDGSFISRQEKSIHWKEKDKITLVAHHNEHSESYITMKINDKQEEIMFKGLTFPKSGVYPCFSGGGMEISVTINN